MGAPPPDTPVSARRIILADHVLLGDAPALRDGAIVVGDDGVIVEAGPARDVLVQHDLPIEHVAGVVFPGLVNAHTHVELSSMRGKVPGGQGFVPWADRLIPTRTETAPEEDAEGIGRGIEELLRAATVAVGDVSNGLGTVLPLARAGIGGSIFHEVLGMDRATALRRVAGLPSEVEEHVPRWPTSDLAYAPAPHSLFTLHHEAARALIDAAIGRGLRTSLHLAEHASERRAVEHGDGPMLEFYRRRFKQEPRWSERPLFDLADDVGALRPGVLLVHLTDARPDELARVARSGASVVLCPRSNLYIDAQLPPLLAMQELGIEAALGTDSLASNTSLDVLGEAKAFSERFPAIPAWELVKMATWNGARALGRDDLGRIAKGARPGLFAVDGVVPPGADPARFLLSNLRAPRRMILPRLVAAPRAKESS